MMPHTCDLCREPLRDCLCWECSHCGTVCSQGDDGESEGGEMICDECWEETR